MDPTQQGAADRTHTEPRRIELHIDTKPAAVPAGGEVVLTFLARCPCGCDLRGAQVVSSGQLDAAQSVHLVAEITGEVRIVRRAPTSVGEETLTLRLEVPEPIAINHHGSTVTVSYVTLPHDCSFAVWDIPTTVQVGHAFTPTIGITCSSGCDLGGECIDVFGEDGALAARAVLSDEPWTGTRSLFAAGVTLLAPPHPGRPTWTFRVAPRTPDSIAHSLENATFACAICAPPDHRITVLVSNADTRLPIEEVEVRLGPFRARTNELGVANLAVARGTYFLDVWKAGFADRDGGLVQVDRDLTIALESTPVAQTNPDDERVWM